MQREQQKQEFAFLKPESPFRPYYDHRVAEISKQLLQGMGPEESKLEEVIAEVEPQVKEQENINENQQQDFLNKVFVELKEPDPEKYIT